MHIALTFMTGRKDPHLEWVLAALDHQVLTGDDIELIVIDALARPAAEIGFRARPWISNLIESAPKPNVWQGAHRVTDREWWATANARNTAIALCPSDVDYMAFLDDRSTPGPRWLATVRRYYLNSDAVVVGSYDKIEGKLDGGHIEHPKTPLPPGAKLSQDHRRGVCPKGKINCGGGWLYGCTFALPLEWAFQVNGFEEGCDGLTGEDYIFGLMLSNAGRRIDFAPDLYVLQDRTTGNESCKGSYACRDKGTSPNDKSHAALARFGKRRRTEFTPDLRALRQDIAAGKPWPLPDPNQCDWFDGELVRDMKPTG